MGADFLPDSVKVILLGILGVFFALSTLARKYPGIAWLQAFKRPQVQHSEEEQRRRRRFGNRMAAMEIMIAGLALPLVYMFATVFMFNDFGTLATIIVLASSAACIALGIWLFARNW
jgi:hypothetical protein